MSSRISRKSMLIASAFLVLTVVSSVDCALAQRAESGGTGTGAWQLIRQPMALPDLPSYTGQAKFVDGLMYPNKPGGAAITLHFLTREEPDTVLEWYSSALSSYQWKMGKSSGKDRSVQGTKGKNGVVVRVSPANQKGFHANLRISYKLSSR